jgi:hypothetical protein
MKKLVPHPGGNPANKGLSNKGLAFFRYEDQPIFNSYEDTAIRPCRQSRRRLCLSIQREDSSSTVSQFRCGSVSGSLDDMKKVSLLLLAICWACGCSSFESTTATAPLANVSATLPPASGQVQPEPTNPPPFVFVRGEFRNPGRYAWTNGMTLSDAFAAAGGFTDFARRQVRLLHWDGSSQNYRWSTERSLTINPVLKPGDSVINIRDF